MRADQRFSRWASSGAPSVGTPAGEDKAEGNTISRADMRQRAAGDGLLAARFFDYDPVERVAGRRTRDLPRFWQYASKTYYTNGETPDGCKDHGFWLRCAA